MKQLIFLVTGLLFLVPTASSQKNFVLLIAGSNIYVNYRHQADVCHAYQIFHKQGIPDEQIVVMMYDDIANNKENPFKGNIINRPFGPNVYPGVPKDYTGDDVNAEVFLAVLQGDKDKVKQLTGKDGKVIASGPNDNIFVYYADHGATGILSMPTSQPLKARALNNALQAMHKQKKFAKMVFYVEACESGSMFKNILPSDINVYAVTAANSTESSWSYYDSILRQTFLGDLFSISFLEDTDVANLHTESFATQFEKVQKRVLAAELHSHPQQFGNKSMAALTLDKFMANKSLNLCRPPKSSDDRYKSDAVPSELVPITILRRRVANTPQNSPLRNQLEVELKQMEKDIAQTYELFWQIASIVNGGAPKGDEYKAIFDRGQDIEDFDCYETALDIIFDVCKKVDTNINSVFLRNLYILSSLCNHEPSEKVFSAVKTAARSSPLCIETLKRL